MKRLMKHFYKEEDGGFVEYIIILAFVGVVLAALWPQHREDTQNIAERMFTAFDPSSNPYSTQTPTPQRTPLTNRSLQEPIITMFPVNQTVSKRTLVSFSAATFGGTDPYEYFWNGYNGKTNGDTGPGVRFPSGLNHIGVTVKDDTGATASKQMSFIVKGLEFKREIYDTNGNRLTPPYQLNQDFVVKMESTNGENISCKQLTSGFSQRNSCTSQVFNFPTPEVLPFEVRICDDDSECEIYAEKISVGPTTIHGVIHSDPNGDFLSDEYANFKVVASGGSGQYDITWLSGFQGSPSNDTWGLEKLFSVGHHVVRAKICDRVNTQEPCAYASTQFDVGLASGGSQTLQASIISDLGRATIYDYEEIAFKVIASGGNGNYTVTWDGYSGNSSHDTLGNPSRFAPGTHQIKARVCDSDNVCGNAVFDLIVTDYVELTGVITPSVSGSINIGDPIHFKIDVAGGSGIYDISWIDYSGGVNQNGVNGSDITYTASGQYTIKAKVCDMNAPGFPCEEFEYTVDVQDATPLDVVIKGEKRVNNNGVSSYVPFDYASEGVYQDFQDFRFKYEVTNGSGNYSATWSRYNGSTQPNTFGAITRAAEPAGTTHISQLTVCDNDRASLPCTTVDLTYPIKAYSLPRADFETTFNPNSNWIRADKPFQIRIWRIRGGLGTPTVSYVPNGSDLVYQSANPFVFGETKTLGRGQKYGVKVQLCDEITCTTSQQTFTGQEEFWSLDGRYIELPADFSQRTANREDFTIEARMTLTQGYNAVTFLSKPNWSNQNKLNVNFNNDVTRTTINGVYHPVSLNPNQINLYSYVFRGNTLEFYENGVLKLTTTIDRSSWDTRNFIIGYKMPHRTEAFANNGGNISSIRLWTVARTSADIIADMNEDKLTSGNGLYSSYKMNYDWSFITPAAGSAIQDLSGNNHPAIIHPW